LDACRKEGIDPKNLIKKPANAFTEPGVHEKIAAMRYKFYQHKRAGILELS